MTRTLLKIASLLGLLIMLIPSVLFLTKSINEERVNFWVMIGTVLWFLSASFWIVKEEDRY